MNGIKEVLIKDCNKQSYWYKDMIGRVMEVFELDKDHYAIQSEKKTVKRIDKKDCEVIKE